MKVKKWVYRIHWFKLDGGKNYIPDGVIYKNYEQALFQAQAQKEYKYYIETIELV